MFIFTCWLLFLSGGVFACEPYCLGDCYEGEVIQFTDTDFPCVCDAEFFPEMVDEFGNVPGSDFKSCNQTRTITQTCTKLDLQQIALSGRTSKVNHEHIDKVQTCFCERDNFKWHMTDSANRTATCVLGSILVKMDKSIHCGDVGGYFPAPAYLTDSGDYELIDSAQMWKRCLGGYGTGECVRLIHGPSRWNKQISPCDCSPDAGKYLDSFTITRAGECDGDLRTYDRFVGNGTCWPDIKLANCLCDNPYVPKIIHIPPLFMNPTCNWLTVATLETFVPPMNLSSEFCEYMSPTSPCLVPDQDQDKCGPGTKHVVSLCPRDPGLEMQNTTCSVQCICGHENATTRQLPCDSYERECTDDEILDLCPSGSVGTCVANVNATNTDDVIVVIDSCHISHKQPLPYSSSDPGGVEATPSISSAYMRFPLDLLIYVQIFSIYIVIH